MFSSLFDPFSSIFLPLSKKFVPQDLDNESPGQNLPTSLLYKLSPKHIFTKSIFKGTRRKLIFRSSLNPQVLSLTPMVFRIPYFSAGSISSQPFILTTTCCLLSLQNNWPIAYLFMHSFCAVFADILLTPNCIGHYGKSNYFFFFLRIFCIVTNVG